MTPIWVVLGLAMTNGAHPDEIALGVICIIGLIGASVTYFPR
jgi:hypothetical protein